MLYTTVYALCSMFEKHYLNYVAFMLCEYAEEQYVFTNLQKQKPFPNFSIPFMAVFKILIQRQTLKENALLMHINMYVKMRQVTQVLIATHECYNSTKR